MKITIEDSQPKLNEERLQAVESGYGIRLPDAYRQFLLEHNGGRPIPALFQCTDGRGSLVDRFLAIHSGPHDNFEDYYHTFKVTRKAVPENIIPIAHDPFGNLICLSISGGDMGSVYFWEHERETKISGYKNLHLIADNLQGFLNGLHEHSQTDLEKKIHEIFYRKSDAAGLERLIESGWDVNSAVGPLALPALEVTVINNQVDLARVLLRRGAQVGKALERAERKQAGKPTAGRDYTEMILLLQGDYRDGYK